MDDCDHAGGTPTPPFRDRARPAARPAAGPNPAASPAGNGPDCSAPAPDGVGGSRDASAARGEPSAGLPADDFDADAEMARWVADLEAGRERIPDPWETEGPAVSVSLGDACDLDPALLAAITGPDGLGGQALSPAFGQDAAADALRPGPVLAALTEQAVSGISVLSDDELTGALQAARRLENRAAWLQTVAVAEFARRRAAQNEDAKARRVPKARRPGEFPADELAMELVTSGNYADLRIERDLELTTRLPRTLAGMAAGLISADRADVIAGRTVSLTDADAAHADEVLAAVAPELRVDQLARKAAALEMKLNPEGVKARKEHARQTRQRVEVRREDSGNAAIAGRELDTATALASKAYIDAIAVRVRNSGLTDATLSAIRARVMTELLQGRNPLDLIKPRPRINLSTPNPGPEPVGPPSADHHGGAADDGDGDGARGAGTRGEEPGPHGDAGFRDPDDPGPDYPDYPDSPGDLDEYGDFGDADDFGDFGDFVDPAAPVPGYAGPDGASAWTADEAANARWGHPSEPDDLPPRRGPLRPGESAPPPANLNLVIPIGTLLGWSTAPAQAGGFGLLDPDETRALVAAASRHPRTRWSISITDHNGHAIAHGRARGQHPWNPPPPHQTPPHEPPRHQAPPPDQPAPGTSPPNAGQLALLQDLIRALNVTCEPVAQGKCDHRHAEDRYTPSRKLRDLVRARTATCDAPACEAQAVHCDLDHTMPFPQGATCECNLGPKCRRHHRAKQAPGWRVEQPEPGITRWTLPNGRTHTTRPTIYET